jgi:hypothetical protein
MKKTSRAISKIKIILFLKRDLYKILLFIEIPT